MEIIQDDYEMLATGARRGPALQNAREVDKDTAGVRRPVRLGRG